MTAIRPAPKHLAMLAAEMRADWDYDETRAALIAASQAGWDPERIYRETFRLLLLPDSSPADLRHASRNPLRPVPSAGDGTLERGLTLARQALEERHDDDPEGGEASESAHDAPEGDEAA